MFGRSKKVDQAVNQELLLNIKRTKKDWESLNNIIERSIEPSEEGLAELALIKAKYFYLLREARVRGINALS